MNLYKNFNKKEEELINYLRKNPNATYRGIRQDTKIKVERLYPKNGMKSAYIKAGIQFSKSLQKRTREQMVNEVIEFIRSNACANTISIKKELRIDIPKIFGTISKAYKVAGIKCIDYRNINTKKIVNLIQTNPLLTSKEIKNQIGLNIYSYFKDMGELYNKANLDQISGGKKRLIKKQNQVLEYIKNNSNPTQYEINKKCETHVQEIFTGGITEAYKRAGVEYPIERKTLYGASNMDIKKRALDFEKEIITILKNVGLVIPGFKTKLGIADALLIIENTKYFVEIKDYQSKPISLSDIKQLNGYINSLDDCNAGILVCRIKGKKSNFYIDGNRIFVLTKDELGGVAQLG